MGLLPVRTILLEVPYPFLCVHHGRDLQDDCAPPPGGSDMDPVKTA